MPKTIPRTGYRRRFGSRRGGRISLRKKIVDKIGKGVVHIQASFHNIIVTVTDLRGRVVSWSSAGTCGFKGTRKRTPVAARTATEDAIGPVIDQGMKRAEVMIKGPGLGRRAALQAIRRSRLKFTFIRDVTPMPHNGCRPVKRRRV
uniref:ribosomal protein S11 n=1 Tax=Bignonia magnifica TaxID=354051 RepID=UPI001FCD7132|nr:ribosomal protein S11 [Bignonia magnifica]YP_010334465.1 ribosomal protein S11 [Bignonia magnifica]UNH90379.1 ribosomal protein S11 [Bignonia magnifica]UNH90380.1 ribosomal protein S11 [Bignonia magnifica]